jgi:hypothetical protein
MEPRWLESRWLELRWPDVMEHCKQGAVQSAERSSGVLREQSAYSVRLQAELPRAFVPRRA